MAEQDSFISDESSFYGDEDEQEELELRVKEQGTSLFNYWSNHDRMINTIAWKARAPLRTMAVANMKRRDSDVEMTDVNDLYNPWEGNEDAWQLGETISDFTKRLPVLGSSHVGPWIWIANPYADRRRSSDPEQHDASFVQLAVRMLKEFVSKKDALTATHPEMAPGTVTRTMKPHRDQLKDDILELAKERKMTCGKWMLFPKSEDAPRYWYKVAEATADNRLGIAAKVSTGLGEVREERLICIYTKDFSDMDDVRRVLQGLVELDLVDPRNPRGIYYKCDAYTYLDINSGNEYGLPASLYSSRELLKPASDQGEMKQPPKGPKKQMTLDGFCRS